MGEGGEGVGTPLHKRPYRYVPPLKVWDLCRFGFKTDIDFAHVGLESGMVFQGTMGEFDLFCCFNSK